MFVVIVLVGALGLTAAYIAAKNCKIKSYSDWGGTPTSGYAERQVGGGPIQTVSAVPSAVNAYAIPGGSTMAPASATVVTQVTAVTATAVPVAAPMAAAAPMAVAVPVAAFEMESYTDNPISGGGAAPTDADPEAFLRKKRQQRMTAMAAQDDDI